MRRSGLLGIAVSLTMGTVAVGCGSGSGSSSTTPAPTLASVSLSASALTFASQLLGSTSAAQTATVTNTGGSVLTLAGVSVIGSGASQFLETTACGATLAAGASCTLSATYSPTTAGNATATVILADNAASSPQTITLTGTGLTPASVSLSTTSLTFAGQAAGTTSPALTVTLTNTGGAALAISGATVSGANAAAFALTTTCGTTLAAGATCTYSVTFSPAVGGTESATISLADSAANTPQIVTLSGTGLAPALTVSTSSLAFYTQAVATSSAPQPVTLTNSGTSALAISSLTLGGTNAAAFSRTTTCGATLAAGTSCVVGVTFTPAATGTMAATLGVADNAAGSPQAITLGGTGVTGVSFTKVSSTAWTASNGIVTFTMNPTNFGITALTTTINGVTTNWQDPSYGESPFGHAIGFYNLYSYLNPSTVTGANVANYSLTGDYVDIWVNKQSVPGQDPLAVENHWVLRAGDAGVYFYQVLRHTAADAATNFGAATTNFFPSYNAIAQADGSTLYYGRDIGPHNMGATLEGFPTVVITQGILATGPGRQVQAETVDYTGAGGLGTYLSAPGLDREFITKYNYSTYAQYHVAHGAVGAQNAFWWVVPSEETLMGGPTKQTLTTVQIEYQSAHLGGQNLTFAAGQVGTRLYGPYYLHFNSFNSTNTTNDQLYFEAAGQVPSCLQFFNEEATLDGNGYVTTPNRGALQAKIASSGWSSTTSNNVVMLTDNQTYFQESANGYQYWGYADANGNVTIPNVIPGTYRLTSYIDGQWGVWHQDNVVINGGATTNLTGLTFTPRNFSVQPPVWTIGTPDRSAGEFLHGHDAQGREVRDYLAIGNYWKDLAANLGKVVYTVGSSDIATSWPFIQYGTFYPGLYAGVYNAADTTSDGYNYITPAYVVSGAVSEGKTAATFNRPNWEVHFTTTAAQLAQGQYVLVSINLAGEQSSSLQVRINGKHKAALLWYPLLDSDPNVRSGVAGYNDYAVFQFPVTDLNSAGQDNVLTLYATGAVLYDALKLEIGSGPADPALTGWPEYDWLYYNAAGSSTQVSASAP